MANLLKTIGQWFSYGLLLAAAVGVILAGKADPVRFEALRMQATGAVAPILEILASPLDSAVDAVDSVHRWIAVAEQNETLRLEVARLREWQSVAERLEAENAELRALLNFVPEPSARFVAARVVADSGGAFAHSILLNAGEQHGVKRGHIVMNGEGLIGRVVGVAPRAARALLLTDLNSRVPVVVGPQQVRAILAGDNTERPKLIHVEPGPTVRVGDRVLTSAVTGAFPPGLPVGLVAETDRLEAAVTPLFDRARLDYVRIVDIGLMPALAEALKPAHVALPAQAPGRNASAIAVE
jgi:rod shape-determining protein MreC